MSDFPPFVPHPFMTSGHAQTILAPYLPGQSRPYQAQQHYVPLPDGDTIVLHDDCPDDWQPQDRMALLIHGVAGCHLSPYLVRLVDKLKVRGIRTWRMDLRGCGAGIQLARHAVHAGRSEDVYAAANFLGQLCPAAPLTVAGYSLGGNIALKMAGEVGGQAPGRLDSVIAIGPPLDLVCCGEHIDSGLAAIYSRRFARMLTRFVQERRGLIAGLGDVRLSPAPTSIVEFDNRFTAPLCGFADVWDYYRRASAAPLLNHIQLPTLIIAATDDPVVPAQMFERAKLSATTELRMTPRGGHVGFIGRRGLDQDRWWLDWRIIDWISRLKESPARQEPAAETGKREDQPTHSGPPRF